MKTFTLFLILLFPLGVFAQDPGDLWTDFGSGGIVMEEWPDTTTLIFNILTLPDNTLVAPYHLYDAVGSTEVIMVSKADATGEIVPFGNSSRGFRYDFSEFEIAYCIKSTPEGSFLVAGSYGALMNAYPYVMKLSATGELDENFGDEGIFTDLDRQIAISCMELFPVEDSYYILLTGQNQVDHCILMMLDATGQLVTTFGDMGVLDLGYFDGIIRDIDVDPVNDFLFASINLMSGGIRIMKLSLPEGTADTDFGSDGILSFTPTEDFYGAANSLVYKAENNTLAIFGTYPHPAGDKDIYAYRVNADDGTADATFGVSGLSTLRSAASDEEINTAILQSDGKYYLGGVTNFSGTDDFLLIRLNDNGLGDTEFGTNGLYILVAPLDQEAYDLELNTDESILYAAGNLGGMEQALIISAHHTGYEVPLTASQTDRENLIAYPNPTFGIINIETGYIGTHSFELLSISGSVVKSGQFNDRRFQVNISSLPPSAYFLKISMPDKQVKTFKILKQN